MNIAKLIIDLTSVIIGIYISFVFYRTFWTLLSIDKRIIVLWFFSIVILHTCVIFFLENVMLSLAFFILVSILISLRFSAGILSKILFALILSALSAVSEIIVGIIMTGVLDVSVEYIRNNMTVYAIAAFSSKAVALIFVYTIKHALSSKKTPENNKFNLMMLSLPIQSLILCFVVFGITMYIEQSHIRFLGILAVAVSFLLIVIVAFIINNQLEAMEYKKEYELSQIRLTRQIEHYNELYSAEQKIRRTGHDLKNNLSTISGLINSRHLSDAQEFIEKIQSGITISERVINTGIPAIDAILCAKIDEAAEKNIDVKYNMFLKEELCAEQFDIVTILANALDNAIEAVAKSENINTDINVKIVGTGGYLSILVENHTSAIVENHFETTKIDKTNHGFGMKQMRDVAEKYDGSFSADFDPETRKFSLKVLLCNKTIR